MGAWRESLGSTRVRLQPSLIARTSPRIRFATTLALVLASVFFSVVCEPIPLLSRHLRYPTTTAVAVAAAAAAAITCTSPAGIARSRHFLKSCTELFFTHLHPQSRPLLVSRRRARRPEHLYPPHCLKAIESLTRVHGMPIPGGHYYTSRPEH